MKKIFLCCAILFYHHIVLNGQSEWVVYNSSNSPLPSNHILNITIDPFNNKWISTETGLLKINDGDFTDFTNWEIIPTPNNWIFALLADNSGNIWFGGNGLIKYDGDNFTVYNTQNSGLPSNKIYSIIADFSNNIWIMCGWQPNIYLVKFDGNNSWQQFPGNFTDLIGGGDIAGIDSSGMLYNASFNKFTRFNTLTDSLTEWNIITGLYITAVKPDYKGNVWIAGGTAGWGGLTKFDGQNFTTYDFYATSLAVDKHKRLWVGTQSIANDTLKLIIKNEDSWIEFTLFNSPLPNGEQICDLEFDNLDNIWIANSQSGIAVYKQGGFILPVELITFTADVNSNSIWLSWATATEINNKGFNLERMKEGSNGWMNISFIDGKGTTTEKQFYSFVDENVTPGEYSYRLKQVDYDGSFEYSKEIEVKIGMPVAFGFYQNYPNPFNPTTKIKYSIPQSQNPLPEGARGGLVTLKVYDVLGNEVSTLINEQKSPGEYEVEFDGSNLSSGIYFYQIKSGKFIQTNKMILLK